MGEEDLPAAASALCAPSALQQLRMGWRSPNHPRLVSRCQTQNMNKNLPLSIHQIILSDSNFALQQAIFKSHAKFWKFFSLSSSSFPKVNFYCCHCCGRCGAAVCMLFYFGFFNQHFVKECMRPVHYQPIVPPSITLILYFLQTKMKLHR